MFMLLTGVRNANIGTRTIAKKAFPGNCQLFYKPVPKLPGNVRHAGRIVKSIAGNVEICA
jgi:hypothetical protein